MKISNVLIFAFVALAVGAGLYWYHLEGADLLQQILESENKPFMLR